MRMTVWDPFRVTRRMSNLIDDDFFMQWDDDTQLDMYEESDSIIVKLKAPGFEEKDIDITLDSNSLTITGNVEMKEEEEDKKKKYYKKEIRQQSFTRSVNLPTKVESEKANAEFKNGILTLTLPKAEEVKPKKITIKAS